MVASICLTIYNHSSKLMRSSITRINIKEPTHSKKQNDLNTCRTPEYLQFMSFWKSTRKYHVMHNLLTTKQNVPVCDTMIASNEESQYKNENHHKNMHTSMEFANGWLIKALHTHTQKTPKYPFIYQDGKTITRRNSSPFTS